MSERVAQSQYPRLKMFLLDNACYPYHAQGFEEYCPKTGEKMVYRLRRSRYGLVQAAKVWNDVLMKHLTEVQHFVPLHSDSSCLVKGTFPELIIVSTLVDDMGTRVNLYRDRGLCIGDLF